MLRHHRLLWPGVHQHEAAGTVGRFGHARLEARLAEKRGLLVARHAADRELAIEQAGRCEAEEMQLLSWTSGSSAGGHSKEPAKLLVSNT